MVFTLLQPLVTSARLTPYLYLSTPLPAGAFYLTRSQLSLPIYLRYRHPIIVFTVNVVRSLFVVPRSTGARVLSLTDVNALWPSISCDTSSSSAYARQVSDCASVITLN